MTRERVNHLLDLVDEVNEKVYVSATLEHGLDDRIFVSLFYQGEKKYEWFCTNDSSGQYDPDLEQGEAFLEMLLAEAYANPKARREAWKYGVYQG